MVRKEQLRKKRAIKASPYYMHTHANPHYCRITYVLLQSSWDLENSLLSKLNFSKLNPLQPTLAVMKTYLGEATSLHRSLTYPLGEFSWRTEPWDTPVKIFERWRHGRLTRGSITLCIGSLKNSMSSILHLWRSQQFENSCMSNHFQISWCEELTEQWPRRCLISLKMFVTNRHQTQI